MAARLRQQTMPCLDFGANDASLALGDGLLIACMLGHEAQDSKDHAHHLPCALTLGSTSEMTHHPPRDAGRCPRLNVAGVRCRRHDLTGMAGSKLTAMHSMALHKPRWLQDSSKWAKDIVAAGTCQTLTLCDYAT